MNEQFLVLAKKLKEASEKRDFEAMIELDKEVRLALQDSLAMIKTDKEKELAISVLKRYQKVYDLIMKDAVKYRDDISVELKKLTKESKAANFYLDSSKFR